MKITKEKDGSITIDGEGDTILFDRQDKPILSLEGLDGNPIVEMKNLHFYPKKPRLMDKNWFRIITSVINLILIFVLLTNIITNILK